LGALVGVLFLWILTGERSQACFSKKRLVLILFVVAFLVNEAVYRVKHIDEVEVDAPTMLASAATAFGICFSVLFL